MEMGSSAATARQRPRQAPSWPFCWRPSAGRCQRIDARVLGLAVSNLLGHHDSIGYSIFRSGCGRFPALKNGVSNLQKDGTKDILRFCALAMENQGR